MFEFSVYRIQWQIRRQKCQQNFFISIQLSYMNVGGKLKFILLYSILFYSICYKKHNLYLPKCFGNLYFIQCGYMIRGKNEGLFPPKTALRDKKKVTTVEESYPKDRQSILE